MEEFNWIKYVWDEKKPLLDKNIKNLEERLGVTFPNDYLNIVKEHQGQSLNENIVVRVRNGLGVVGYLLHFLDEDKYSYSIMQEHEYIEEEFPEKIIPFQSAGGANIFAFDYRIKKDDPSVVFINSDIEGEEAIIPVADNFTDFMNQWFVGD